MRLLVTGGAGFIGANFIRFWMERHPDDEVVNFDKLTYAGDLARLKEVEKNPHYRFIKGDILDPMAVEEAIKGVDILVHFAAESHVDRSISKPAVFIRTNIIGMAVLLEAALKHKISRFHHVSTDEVFGALSLDTSDKFNEETCYRPASPYAASKASSDHLVRAYGITFGLPFTITNCSNNFGPFQNPEKFIPFTIANVLEGKKVPIYGDGLNVRDWLYVLDHCRAISLVLEKGKLGETYCIGGPEGEINNLELAKKILKLMGKSEEMIEMVKDRPGHDRRYSLDWRKIKKELGWQPKYDLGSCLEETISWYQLNRDWWQKIKQNQKGE